MSSERSIAAAKAQVRESEDERRAGRLHEVDATASDDAKPSVIACITPRGRAPVVTDAVIASTAEQIRDLAQRTQLLFAFQVGEIVIQRFYAGDLAEWRSRGRKATSLRALAVRLKELDSMSAPTLFRCISIYELLRDHGGVAAWSHISVTHVRAVLPLRDAAQEIELLRRAEAEAWPARRLERTVQRRRQRAKVRRSASGSLGDLAGRIERDAAELRERLRQGPPRRRELRRNVFERVLRARESLDDVQSLANPKRHA